MSYDQKRTIASLFTAVLVFAAFLIKAQSYARAGAFDGPEGMMFFGKFVLIIIAAGIVLNIVNSIIFVILHAIATRDEHPDFTSDERDQHIDQKGIFLFLCVVSAGFVLAMALLVSGVSPLLALGVIFAGFPAGDILNNLLKLLLYQRGI